MQSKTRNNTWLIIFILFAGVIANFFFTGLAKAQSEQPSTENKAIIYLFWGDGCPHCAKEKPILEALAKNNPNVELRFYEVWNSQPNRDVFVNFTKAYGFEPKAVPTTFLGDKYWVGFNDQIQGEIQQTVESCLAIGCVDAGAIVSDLPKPDNAASVPTVEPEPTKPTITQGGLSDVIDIPLIGKVDLDKQSLLVSTLLIAFVDGVNPCSIWVLSMLLALTLHTGSRKKIVIIGLIFISVTALVYALFILGLFSVMSIIPYQGIIQAIVAVIAIIFGVINIKDYFWYKEGVTLSISDEKKPGIYKSMRKVLDAQDSFWGLAGATIVMAAGVSLVEFSCTAGFPVVWTNLLNANNASWLTFGLLLLLYMAIYQLDELAIFFTAVFTLKATKLEEKQGRILKLIGGILMLTLSVVMLVNPQLMNQLSGSLIIFLVAFGLTGLVLLIHRVILPRMGIHIGSEFNGQSRGKKKKH